MKLPPKKLIQKGKSIIKNEYGLVSSFLFDSINKRTDFPDKSECSESGEACS